MWLGGGSTRLLWRACSMYWQRRQQISLERMQPCQKISSKNLEKKLSADYYASILKRCSNEKALVEGRKTHVEISRNGLQRDKLLGNLLIQMYGNCGSMEEAHTVFNEMKRRNVFTWTILIQLYVHHGYIKKAFHLFLQMQMDGVIPDRITFISILSVCAKQTLFAEGKQVHACIVSSGLDSDLIVQNALVYMYSKCGSLDDACDIFDRMRTRDVVSWTSMIAAYAEHGEQEEALHLFEEMQLEGVMPNRPAFLSVLNACCCSAFLDYAARLHACIVNSGYQSDVVVGNALIFMYTKCGSLKNAWRMFDTMPNHDVISWNAIVAAYIQHGQDREALQLFQQMQIEGVSPNKITFARILSACGSEVCFLEGKQIHLQIIQSGLESDVLVGNSLLSMYSKCGSLKDAREVFDKMPQRNTVSWNAMIAAYVQNEHNNEALHVFQQMQSQGITPDRLTFVSVLDACGSKAALTEGRQIHGLIMGDELESEVTVANALITMYGKCNCLVDAQKVFRKMPVRNNVSWNAIIAAYTQHGQDKEALQLFKEMLLKGVIPDRITFVSCLSACADGAALAEGKHLHSCIKQLAYDSDIVISNALVNMYGKCGSLDDARRLFDEMPEQDVFSWNAVIGAYAVHEQGKEALQLFEQMQLKGVIADKFTFTSIISACATQTALVEGKWIHAFIEGTEIESDVVVANALISMYGKCGSLEDAWSIFDKIPERNAVSWTSLIAAYAQHGQCKEALQIFQHMQLHGTVPDKVTFVSVLSACSHSGMVEQGCYEFVSMIRNHCLVPAEEHYNCMIDLLGRTGQLDEGEDLINNMPIQSTATSWMTLLGACRMHRDTDRGKRAAYHAFVLNPKNVSPYVLLSHIHAANGKWCDASTVRSNVGG